MPPKPGKEKLPMNVVDKKWFTSKEKLYEPYRWIEHAKCPEKNALEKAADFFAWLF